MRAQNPSLQPADNRAAISPPPPPAPPPPLDEAPRALTFFLTVRERRDSLRALRRIHPDRAIALARALRLPHYIAESDSHRTDRSTTHQETRS